MSAKGKCHVGGGMRVAGLGFRGLLWLLCLLMALPAMAQIPFKTHTYATVPPDSADLAYHAPRHFWRASAEVVGMNTLLWGYDRYIRNGDFARISLHSIAENFRHGFKWDNDNLNTNTFMHPYNGSIYYNAGRANGYNFWQSELFAIGGSAMWEMFMENEYPSTNDIIATPIGGACIGEVLFRASDALIDDRCGGMERASREIGVFLLDPMRGFNRIVTGQAWRRRATRGRLFGRPPISLMASAGTRILIYGARHPETHVGAVVRLDVEYGDRFEVKSTKPYDYFTVRAELNFMQTQPALSQLQIKGRLLAREFLEKVDQHASVGLYQHFDFFDSDSVGRINTVPYKLGIPASVGVGVMFRDIERRRWVFDAYAHVNGVLLGSVLSDHYQVDQRNYNWASGFSTMEGLNLVFDRDRFSFSVSHELYRLFTFQGYRQGTDLATADPRTLNSMGDACVTSFNMLEAGLSARVWRQFYVALYLTAYFRDTRYRDFPDIHSRSTSLRLLLQYKL